MATKQQLIDKLDPFTFAHISALFWITNEEEFPEYCYSGEFTINDSDILKLSKESLESIISGCKQFQEHYRELLDKAGTDHQNGHDFALSRNRQGAGFFDRGYG